MKTNMTAKHSKLPWKAQKEGQSKRYLRVRAEDGLIADLSYCARNMDDSEANAALIVAAVNSHHKLLAACHSVILSADGQEHVAEEMGWTAVEVSRRALQRLRDAIANAEKPQD